MTTANVIINIRHRFH